MNVFISVAHAGMIEDATPLREVLVNSLEFLLTISGTIGIIALVITGITYLGAASSGNEQLQRVAKKGVVVVIIGMSVIMGSMILVRFIAQMLAGGGNE